MKVLFVGDMRLGANSRSVHDGYVELGCDVRSVDTGPSLIPKGQRGRHLDHENRVWAELKAATDGFLPDLLVAVKTIRLPQEYFFDIAAEFRAHLSFDDVSNPDNVTPQYLASESRWDCIITTKKHNIPELLSRGAQRAHFVWGAYDPRYRHVTTSLQNREFVVGFIGVARPDRRELPHQLASVAPHRAVIYGPRWRRWYPWGVRNVKMVGTSMAAQYTTAANSIQMGLVLLNSENRDRHTNRSIETPATGQMVLAERTEEHQELFVENEEAVFFDSRQEMLRQIDDLKSNDALRLKIAEAGRRRIVGGNFTYLNRARDFVAYVANNR